VQSTREDSVFRCGGILTPVFDSDLFYQTLFCTNTVALPE
jgi:hypothetical protein